MSNSEDYHIAFTGRTCDANLIKKAAFKKAVETRKFEIQLYWKRATYFWTMIAAAFAGYFVVQSPNNQNNRELSSFVISCVGFFLTLAWFLVNKGSKFWQENWENHVALLGEQVVGPLYDWVLCRPDNLPKKWLGVTQPAPLSVSKINQWVSLYVLLIWIVLIFFASPLTRCESFSFLQRHPFAWCSS